MKAIRSLQKGIDILFLFTGNQPAMTVEEIARRIDMPVPSAYRFIATLREKGLLERDDRSGRYALGLKLLELEGALHRKSGLEAAAAPLLKELAAACGETVQLTVLNGDRGVCIFVEESTSTLRMAPEKGRILPLHAGASVQAILAFLPEEDRKRICSAPLPQFTPKTITAPEELAKRLEKISRDGFAESAGEVYVGSVGIAAPVMDRNGKVIASVAVSGPEQRLDKKKRVFIRKEVVRGAGLISAALV